MPVARTTSHGNPAFFDALPPYLGGKRRLCPLIFSVLRDTIPWHERHELTLLDPFCGGGAVALYAKAQGFRVVASDLAERSAIVARSLIANSTHRLRPADILDLYRQPEGPTQRRAAAFVPRVFSAARADWIDRALARAEGRSEPTRSLLRLLIVRVALGAQPMSLLTATDAAAAAEGDFDRVSVRRLPHYLRDEARLRPEALLALAERVNRGVIGGIGRALQGDAREVLARTPADIVYLDPPYAGTTGYSDSYAPLDAVLGEEAIAVAPAGLDELLEASDGARWLVLSYGGPSLTLDELTTTVRRHRPVLRALAVPYPHLRALATTAHAQSNREYLIVAGR